MSIPQTQQAAQLYAQSLSAILDNDDIRQASQILVDSEDGLRKLYLECFAVQANKSNSDPGWFRREFEYIGNMIFNTIRIANNESEVQYSSNDLGFTQEQSKIVIQTAHANFEFNKRMILIGRYDQCDVLIDQNYDTCSRLHAIILALPEIEKFAVLDVGSLVGIKTEGRSSAKTCMHTRPGVRFPLIFEYDETVRLKLGATTIIINPKRCVICQDNFRNIVLSCGHFILCDNCRYRLLDSQCPLCRTDIQDTRMTMRANSFREL